MTYMKIKNAFAKDIKVSKSILRCEFMDIRSFIQHEVYKAYLEELNKYLTEKIDLSGSVSEALKITYGTDKYHKHLEDEYIEDLLNIESELLEMANIGFENLMEIILNNRDQTIIFIDECYKKFSKLTEKEKREVVAELPPYLTFPIGYLINFYLIKNKLNIREYVKKQGIPNANKCIKDLIEIYEYSIKK